MALTKNVQKILKPLSEKQTQAYLTNTLQIADVLEWVLEQTGPAEIFQTSFSISEEFLRRLYFISKRQDTLGITLLLDHKATIKTLKLWTFITQVIKECYLADNHSKILLIKAANGMRVSVITSQNLTRGNRHESSVITTDTDIFDSLHESFMHLIKFQSVPLHELLAARLGDG